MGKDSAATSKVLKEIAAKVKIAITLLRDDVLSNVILSAWRLGILGACSLVSPKRRCCYPWNRKPKPHGIANKHRSSNILFPQATNLKVFSFNLSVEDMHALDSFTPNDAEAPPFFSMAPPKSITSK